MIGVVLINEINSLLIGKDPESYRVVFGGFWEPFKELLNSGNLFRGGYLLVLLFSL